MTNVTPAETDDQSKRAAFVADLRTFADFLARNSWAALPYQTMQADLQANAADIWNGGVDGVAELRRIADGLGEKPDESLDDRSSVAHLFGGIEYKVITWHKSGRPVDRDERDVELERLRAEVAELRAATAPTTPAGIGPLTTSGYDYTRADTDADDPTPVSPARVPLHTGGLVGPVDGGELVTDAEAEHYETTGWTGGDRGSGVACACGVEFGGFDTLAEAGEYLKRHIADGNASAS